MVKLDIKKRGELRKIIKRSRSLDNAAKNAEKLKIARSDVRRYFRRIKGIRSVKTTKRATKKVTRKATRKTTRRTKKKR